jgi:hypothetical protein
MTGHPRHTSDVLGEIEGFESRFGDFGVIIYQESGDFGPDESWNVTESNVRNTIRGLKETGAVVVVFESFPVWDLDGQLTTPDYLFHGYEYEHPEIVTDSIVCVSGGNETRFKKYYEAWGDTVLSRIAEEEGAFFLPIYEMMDCLDLCVGELACCDQCKARENVNPQYNTRIHPRLMALHQSTGYLHHNNGDGYGVFAERFARYLVDWGLAEYVVDIDKISRDLPVNLSLADDYIRDLEGKGHTVQDEIKDELEIAKFLHVNGYHYTPNWILNRKVLSRVGLVVEYWDEVQNMFAQASRCIETLEQEEKTRDVTMSKAFYSKAEKSWAENDYDSTQSMLSNIIAKCPVPEVLPLVLVFLPLLLGGARTKDR